MKRLLLLAVTICFFINFINAQATQLDSSFGTNGIVKTDLGEANAIGTTGADQILLLPDGDMYVLQGQAGNISKRHADGSLDSSFGVNGFAEGVFSFGYIFNMASGPDDKLVTLGWDYDSENSYIGRYNTNGTWDSSFANNGKLITTDWYPEVLAVQKDGKIIISEYHYYKYYVKRFNIDGSIDNSFDGQAINFNPPKSIDIQEDGKIIVAGQIESGFAIARYKVNGKLDKSFGHNGVAQRDLWFTGSLVIQGDGKIIIASSFDSKLSIIRYNTDGTPDTSFGGTGERITNISGFPKALQVVPKNGKILVLIGDVITSIIQLNTDGTTDSSFHQTSIFSLASIAVRPDGKIVGAGSSANGLGLARYNADGSPDTAFHQDGTYTEEKLSGNTGYKIMAVQKDGKIVAAGSYWNGENFDFAIARYNIDGSPDNTFSGDGIQTTDFTSNNDYVRSAVIQKDGKIIVAGQFEIARYNADGSLDNTFSGDGKLTTDVVFISSVSVQNDGKIVVAGAEYYEDSGYPTVARLNADGSIDSTFGINGRQTLEYYNVFGGSGQFTSMLIQKDDKIVIAGVFAPYSQIVVVARLNADGSLDTAYNGTGTKVYGPGIESSFAIVKQSDDEIIISATDTYRYSINRLNTKGHIDNSFKGIRLEGFRFSKINSIALQSDGKVVLATDSLLRFNTAGTLDSTFDGNGVQSPPFAINNMTVVNNKLYIAGGQRYGTIARYLLDSSNTPPTVSLTTPADNAIYLAPAAHIKLTATAADSGGKITKVEFYKDSTLLHTETVIPYGYVWRNVPLGNYTLTAKAYDNSGNITTSAAVHISVVANQPPAVSIINPANNQVFADTATIRLIAAAADTDGRITKVEFYRDSTLLRTEYKYPYTYNWTNVSAGTYTITAKATDNRGAQTTSAPITVTVTGNSIVSNRPYSKTEKTALNDALSLRLSPNPASNTVNIQTSGLTQGTPATLSIISLSGMVLKTMQIRNSATQLEVSTLVRGVYTIKIVSGEKSLYKQFVKL